MCVAPCLRRAHAGQRCITQRRMGPGAPTCSSAAPRFVAASCEIQTGSLGLQPPCARRDATHRRRAVAVDDVSERQHAAQLRLVREQVINGGVELGRDLRGVRGHGRARRSMPSTVRLSSRFPHVQRVRRTSPNRCARPSTCVKGMSAYCTSAMSPKLSSGGGGGGRASSSSCAISVRVLQLLRCFPVHARTRQRTARRR